MLGTADASAPVRCWWGRELRALDRRATVAHVLGVSHHLLRDLDLRRSCSMGRRQALLWLLAAGSGCRGARPSRDEFVVAPALPSSAPSSIEDADVADVDGAGEAGATAMEPAPYPSSEPREQVAGGALDLHDWTLPGDPRIARRAIVLVPRGLEPHERVPVLVLLHGLAETAEEAMGAYAWVRRYGVAEGYARLRDPALLSEPGLRGRLPPERVSRIDADLRAKRFRGFVLVCPYTPNFWRVPFPGGPEAVLDAFAGWLFEVLLPRVRAETPASSRASELGIDGVSLGGYASLAVAIRRLPELGSVGCVQAAVSTADVGRWAQRIAEAVARHGARPLHLLTSDRDVFRGSVEALSAALDARSVEHTLRVAIGLHDQPFLRGPGSVEMLAFHHRVLGA